MTIYLFIFIPFKNETNLTDEKYKINHYLALGIGVVNAVMDGMNLV
jgi:hypothetical protein